MDETTINQQLLDLVKRRGEVSLRDYNHEDESQRMMALGIMVSVSCEWRGDSIAQAFAGALEDANFHDKAALVREWLAE